MSLPKHEPLQRRTNPHKLHRKRHVHPLQRLIMPLHISRISLLHLLVVLFTHAHSPDYLPVKGVREFEDLGFLGRCSGLREAAFETRGEEGAHGVKGGPVGEVEPGDGFGEVGLCEDF